MSIYCLDTNAFIGPWHRSYPIDVFPKYWEQMDIWAKEARVISPDEVLREIKRKDDALHEWLKSRESMFLPPEETVQSMVRKILAKHPRLVDSKKGRSACDPWVIAQATVSKATVVTEEHRSMGKSPKIPDVCDALGIPHTNVLGMMREMGLRF
jgi:hypothetical protein